MESTFSFEEIGLTTRDKRVYETLIANPNSSLRRVAELTGINRGSVYESIKQLVASGLAAPATTGKRSYYIAQDPALIVELLKERQQAAQRAERSADNYIRLLHESSATPETPSIAVQFDGDEGVAAVLRDVLKTMRISADKQYYVISSKRIRQYIYQNFTNYTQQRIKARIRVSVIAVGDGGETDALANRVWLPNPESMPDNCYTIIYGSKTAFITLNDENVLQAIIIDNEGVANLQKLQFNQMWESLCTPTSS